MTYEIKHEPVTLQDGKVKDKYNIYYYGGEFNGLVEFHSYDGVSGTIRPGYTEKK